MKKTPILIIAGEPRSIFFEIYFKSIKKKKYKSPLILICSKEKLKFEMKRNKFKKEINQIDLSLIKTTKLSNDKVNLIDINQYSYRLNKKQYIEKCFEIALKLIKNKFSYKLINGPIDKSSFLDKKYLGVTEYISQKCKQKKTGMLIYNQKLSVCPVTTHLPLKLVAKKISKKTITEKIFLVNNFFINNFGFKPKIAVTGLNPHCETILKFDEDKKIILPAIKLMKKKNINVGGPFSADTVFSKKNRKIYDVIIGMYHDQVLTPVKTLFEFNAINITMGLPFFRVTPDHGPNQKMIGKNLSSPESLIQALNFLDKK